MAGDLILFFVMAFILAVFIVNYLYLTFYSAQFSDSRLLKCQIQLAKNKNYERLFILKGSNPIYNRIREVEFSRKILFWDEPGIDTTYFALEILNRLNADISVSIKNKIKNYIINHSYNDADGGFRQTESMHFSSVHATHCAIGVIKQLYCPFGKDGKTVDHENPMGFKIISDVLSEKVTDNVYSFIKSCESIDGGFRENKNEKKEPTINDTATALWIYWHMGKMPEYSVSNEAKKTISFAIDCFKDIDNDGMSCGFSNKISDQDSIWACTTYYANRLSNYFNEFKVFLEEHRTCQIKFIVSCSRVKGGFGANNVLDPNIIHTKDALSLLSKRWKYLDVNNSDHRRMVAKTIEFVNSCYYNGGHAFAEIKHYSPNIYATRLAFDIAEYIKAFDKNMLASLKIEQEKVIEFIWSCYDEKVGAFTGYPIKKESIKRVA
jgi:prenyltransferase beta subunit